MCAAPASSPPHEHSPSGSTACRECAHDRDLRASHASASHPNIRGKAGVRRGLSRMLVELVARREHTVAHLARHPGELGYRFGTVPEANEPRRGGGEGLADEIARELLCGRRALLREARSLADAFVRSVVTRLRGLGTVRGRATPNRRCSTARLPAARGRRRCRRASPRCAAPRRACARRSSSRSSRPRRASARGRRRSPR